MVPASLLPLSSTILEEQLWQTQLLEVWWGRRALGWTTMAWAMVSLGTNLPLNTLGKAHGFSQHPALVSLPPCVVLIEDLCWKRAKEWVEGAVTTEGNQSTEIKIFCVSSACCGILQK